MPVCDRSCCNKACKRRKSTKTLYNDYKNLLNDGKPRTMSQKKQILKNMEYLENEFKKASMLCTKCSTSLKGMLDENRGGVDALLMSAPAAPTKRPGFKKLSDDCRACEFASGRKYTCKAKRGSDAFASADTTLSRYERACNRCIRSGNSDAVLNATQQKITRFMKYCKSA